MCNVSRLGNNNIRDVCFKINIDLYSLHTVSFGEINNKIIGKWSEGVSDEDKRVGMQVLELYIERDSLNESLFDRGEIFDIINVLCVIYCQHVFMYIILRNYFNVLAINMDV